MDSDNSGGPALAAAPAAAADITGSEWAQRPWLLAGILGIGGLLMHFIIHGHDRSPGWMALAAFVYFGLIFAAFTLDKDRWQEPLIAAGMAGLVMAGLAWRAVDPQNQLADESYAFAAGIVATTLALPLFQAGFHRTRFQTPYRDTHFHVWSDAVSGAGALAFVGLSWALLAVLSQLFLLLKIDLLRELMNKEWFGWTFSGIALGAALGTLRNQLKVIGTLQAVVLLVLSLLAAPLAAALVMFLLAMIVSGPQVLWEATRSATPILLTCAVGAFVLTNAILRDEDSAMTRSRVMRIAALVLALGIFPLTVFAAVSMGTRVAQHGLSPERLWGLVAIGFACAYGLAYWTALLRGRQARWHDFLRQANLHLAVVGCILALVLALPIFDFGAISARNQIARLESGAVGAREFDYDALRWDFGAAGRKALAGLSKGSNAEIARLALEAQQRDQRRYGPGYAIRERRAQNAQIDVEDESIRAAVRAFLIDTPYKCGNKCRVVTAGKVPQGTLLVLLDGGYPSYMLFDPATGKADQYSPAVGQLMDSAAAVPPRANLDAKVELRPFTGQQVFIDGKPASTPFK